MRVLLASIVIFFIIYRSAIADEAESFPCAKETEILMSDSSSWESLMDSLDKLPNSCFDGYFAEGISNTVAVKLVKDWPGFFASYSGYKAKASVNNLLIRSLNASLNPDDLEAIVLLANSECPKEHARICSKMSAGAKTALREINE